MDKVTYDVSQIMDIYEEENNITYTAQRYCEDNELPYTDSIRRKFSNIIRKKRESQGLTDSPPKILIYDIETSRATFKLFWTGKQYVSYRDMIKEPKIISISWKWLGEDKVDHLTWDENQCDKKMMEDFLVIYNKADMLVGVNNDNFDNRWVNARAMKHNLDINMFTKSFDVQKESKRIFRMVSYSMDYSTKFMNTTFKQGHEGIKMWNMIEDGTPQQQKEYLEKMVTYNVGDIVATEDWYIRNRKYMGHKIHAGVFAGKPKFTCPDTGSENVELYKTSVTAAGTVQRIMINRDTKVQYKISNSVYFKWLEYKAQKEIDE